MNNEQDNAKVIYMGYHPRTQDGSSPQARPLSDSTEIMDAFNKAQEDGTTLQAELVKVAWTDLCAVAVRETSMDKVMQYL